MFYHNDLGWQNILVDLETYKIVAIIDWGTAGFSPSEWELPFWKLNAHKKTRQFSQRKSKSKRSFQTKATDDKSKIIKQTKLGSRIIRQTCVSYFSSELLLVK